MKFTTTSQKAHKLGANVTGMNMAKNQQIFFVFRKTTRISKYKKKLVVDNKEITGQTDILEHMREFYETFFKTWEQKTEIEMEIFFSDVDTPKLSENQAKLCGESLTEKDLNFFEKCAVTNLQIMD